MNYAELSDKHAAERKTLAEKHFNEWQQLKTHRQDIQQDIQQGKDSAAAREEAEKVEDDFRNRTAQETKDLSMQQAMEADQLDKLGGIIKESKTNSQWLEKEAVNLDATREQTLKDQQAQVKQEYQKIANEAEQQERIEKYNENNLSSGDPMQAVAEERERKRQEFLEKMKAANHAKEQARER